MGDTSELKERDILYSLAILPGVGRKTLYALHQLLGSYHPLLTEDGRALLAEMRLPQRVQEVVIRAMRTRQVLADKSERLQRRLSFLCFLDEQFPPLLREIPDPPALLFYKGNLDLLKRPMLGVVGTRRPTAYGKAACRFLTTGLARAGFVIVSGLAQGIDAEAHRAALEQGGGTIAVLGSGIEQIYPRQNRQLYHKIAENGLLLSEYAPSEPPRPGLFPERNRLISGLSLGVLIVEAAERSGSLITAECALEQGKEVFAVPGPIFSGVSAGPHNLIKEGAKLVSRLQDVFEEFRQYVAPVSDRGMSRVAALPAVEQRLLDLLGYEPVHWEALYAQLDPAGRSTLDRTLLYLETKGLIAALPGGYYVKQMES